MPNSADFTMASRSAVAPHGHPMTLSLKRGVTARSLTYNNTNPKARVIQTITLIRKGNYKQKRKPGTHGQMDG